MNKDNAKEYLPFVQALADGKTIQLNGSNREEVKFTAPAECYQIKPEPREIYVNIYYGDKNLYLHNTKEEAERARESVSTSKTVLFREVTE